MHEANILLREKNLQLNQQLHSKTRESVGAREQLDSLREQHTDKVRQLEERLKSAAATEVPSIALNDDGIQGEQVAQAHLIECCIQTLSTSK